MWNDNYGQRVVNGQDARKKEFPWLAMLVNNTKPADDLLCAANLIHIKWLLTAAHCVVRKNGNPLLTNEMLALLGVYHTNPAFDWASNIQTMEISRFSFFIYIKKLLYCLKYTVNTNTDLDV